MWVLDVVMSTGAAFWLPFVGRCEISHQRTLVKCEYLLRGYIVGHLFLGRGSLRLHLWGVACLAAHYGGLGEQSSHSALGLGLGLIYMVSHNQLGKFRK